MNANAQAVNALGRLLTPRKRRAVGMYAKDAGGFPVNPSSPEAVCWCGFGGVSKIAHDKSLFLGALLESVRSAMGADPEASLVRIWDQATDEERDEMCRKWREYRG